MSFSSTFLFVYGTLKTGFCRNHLLHAQKKLGEFHTTPDYRMYDCGEYPALIKEKEGHSIRGEVWRVSPDCLKLIDEAEGVEFGLYVRDEIRLIEAEIDSVQRLDDNFTLPNHSAHRETDDKPDANINLMSETIFSYFYNRPVDGLPESGTDWQKK